MSTECIASKLEFQGLGRRRVEAEFNGGEITSDAGGLLLREVESRYGFIQRLQDLRISTSTRGGTYLTVGERLARMLERGCDLRDEDVARLSPFVRSHVNTQGRYSFARPGLGGRLRPLNDPEDETDGL